MNLEKYGPWALIIGGSEGVGAAFARLLAAGGFKLVLVARKPGPLDELAGELRGLGAEVRTVAADLSQSDVLDQVRKQTDDIEVGLLVYNAGANNTRGLFTELPEAVHDEPPTLATYTASKAFSRIFSEALWAELAPLGVDVLHLNIGFTATPAMARLGMPIELAEPPETVAREGLENIANGPVWIVSTPGNIERARMINGIDNRAETVRAHAIVPREETAKAALELQQLVASK